jgi:hypothetical protein
MRWMPSGLDAVTHPMADPRKQPLARHDFTR